MVDVQMKLPQLTWNNIVGVLFSIVLVSLLAFPILGAYYKEMALIEYSPTAQEAMLDSMPTFYSEKKIQEVSIIKLHCPNLAKAFGSSIYYSESVGCVKQGTLFTQAVIYGADMGIVD